MSRESKQTVTDRLRSDILSGEFPPGERLIELGLSKRYDVGRAAIRSAIVELGKEGLVTREANRGAHVRKISLEDAIEINEARAALEGLLARHCAMRATQREKAKLARIGEKMREAVSADDYLAYSELNRELHAYIRKTSHHEIGCELVETLRNRSSHHQFRLAMMPGRPNESLPEHESIIEAIVAGDPDRAEHAMRNHIFSVIKVLERWGSTLAL